MKSQNMRVSDERQGLAIGKLDDPVERGRQIADQDVVRAFTLADRDGDHVDRCWSSAAMIASTTSPWPPDPLRMWIWASA